MVIEVNSKSKCIDKDMNCSFWVAKNAENCFTDANLLKYCKKTCQNCKNETILEEIPQSWYFQF